MIGDKPARPAVIALGANLPCAGREPAATLHLAIAELEAEGVTISGQSRFWHTPCFPAGAGPDYVNAIVIAHADLHESPADLLQILHEIEARHGRERLSRWAGRTLDLDLIAFGDSILPDAATQSQWVGLSPEDQASRAPDQLILPHPRLQDRAFVLAPLAELLPDWRHPVLGLTVSQMLAALPEADRAELRPL